MLVVVWGAWQWVYKEETGVEGWEKTKGRGKGLVKSSFTGLGFDNEFNFNPLVPV